MPGCERSAYSLNSLDSLLQRRTDEDREIHNGDLIQAPAEGPQTFAVGAIVEQNGKRFEIKAEEIL